MIEDKPIDLDIKNTKLNNELIVLRARYNELDEDRHYIKSLLDAEFEKRKKLEKENEQLKSDYDTLQIQDDARKQYQKELMKENEELKQINHNLGDFRRFITEQNVSNEKERKNLQLQMLRLYNYFENYFEDTMSPNAFGEMWDNVKEDEKWEKK